MALARSLYEQKSPPQRPSMAQSFRNRGALSGYIACEVKSFFRCKCKKLKGLPDLLLALFRGCAASIVIPLILQVLKCLLALLGRHNVSYIRYLAKGWPSRI